MLETVFVVSKVSMIETVHVTSLVSAHLGDGDNAGVLCGAGVTPGLWAGQEDGLGQDDPHLSYVTAVSQAEHGKYYLIDKSIF